MAPTTQALPPPYTPTYVSDFNYLQSVVDPVSAPEGSLDGHGRGMASKGASRWAFGHISSRGPVLLGDPLYPHDNQGNGDFWGARFDDALQILTHYYTGIAVRDANNPAALQTPPYRWVPLHLTWPTSDGNPPSLLCRGHSLLPTVWVQNTGTQTWPANRVHLFGRAESQLTAAGAAPATLIPQDVAPGATYTTTVDIYVPPDHPAGTLFAFQLDMFEDDEGYFGAQTPSWPVFRRVIANLSLQECHAFYLPLVQGDATATTTSE
jgi:hypothetical protein